MSTFSTCPVSFTFPFIRQVGVVTRGRSQLMGAVGWLLHAVSVLQQFEELLHWDAWVGRAPQCEDLPQQHSIGPAVEEKSHLLLPRMLSQNGPSVSPVLYSSGTNSSCMLEEIGLLISLP